MAYPADVAFSFLRRQYSSHQIKQMHSNAILLHSALGAECLSAPEIASEKETQEGNVKCPSSTRDDTNSQRPTHFQALSDEQS